MAVMTKRMLQLGEQIREFVATLFARGEIADPRFQGITIHSVKISPDLSVAKIYYSIPKTKSVLKKDVVQGLKRATGFIRHGLSQALLIRHTPELIFYYDPSMDYAEKINSILSDLKNESDKNNE